MERAELIEWVKATGVSEEREGTYFLCDPHWGSTERAAVGVLQATAGSRVAEQGSSNEIGWLCLPTGGTSGGVRFARHDEQTLGAAVTGFCEFFGLERVNAVDVLPPYHVSGLMSRVRCAATGGKHVPCEWRRLEARERPALDGRAGPWVISLVPTQLHRLLETGEAIDWLRGFRCIFVGGGPIWPQLADAAVAAELPIALTYGLTETAAMVAAIKAADFLAGERFGATPLPHARFSTRDEGSICVEGASVFRGYFPELRAARVFETDDLGRIDEGGRLHVIGRKDAVIITGGKKVHPLEVEAALKATGHFADVAVLGVPSPEWGEAVVACYPQGASTVPDLAAVVRELENTLASYKRPKRYVAVADWPRNAQGKLNRRELAERVGN